MRVLAVVPLQILLVFTFYTPSLARLTRARTEYSILSYAIQAPTSEKKRKKGNPSTPNQKNAPAVKEPLVLGFRALPAARRDFASQKSDVRLLTWLHAAAFGVAVGAPPLPRPVVAQQLRCQRSYAPPAQPRRLFAVSLLLSGWRSWLRCQLLRSVRRWVRVRVGRAVRLVRFAVSLFCAGCMGFTPSLRVLRRVWRALVRTTIPPRRFKRGAIARQKRLRGVGGRPAKDARRVCALKPPAAVFGLGCITFVSSRVRFCSIFSGRGGEPPHPPPGA